MDGLDTLKKIRALDNPPEVIMIRHEPSRPPSRTKLGAYDFLEKPLSSTQLSLIKHAIDAKKLRRETGP